MLNRRPSCLGRRVGCAYEGGMWMVRVRNLLLAGLMAALCMVVLGGTASAQGSYRLGTGDKLKVTVFGEEDASGEYEIDAAGTISARLLGRIAVRGMTTSEVEQTLYDQYRSRNIFKNPKISIELLNLRPFFILGEVEKRGQYPYVNGLTVAQAVAIAGGYTYRASRSRITIQRAGAPQEERVDEHAPVYPGDIVRVPERFF
jgi:protein involved in polysaccharide export with SLBB domain